MVLRDVLGVLVFVGSCLYLVVVWRLATVTMCVEDGAGYVYVYGAPLVGFTVAIFVLYRFLTRVYGFFPYM